MKTKLLGAVCVVFCVAASASSSNADVINSINDTGDPFVAASWNVPDVGWIYTPTTSFTFSGIGTKFGSSDGRIVNAEVFSGTPGALVLLGAGGLTPVAGAFAYTTSFPTVDFIAGETYFLGFQNVRGLLVNFANYGPGLTNLGGLYYDFDSSNTFSFGEGNDCCSAVGQPIIEFIGNPVTPSEVPLPTALPLFATGLGVLGLLGWRRKQKPA